jgi:hypothetical protein
MSCDCQPTREHKTPESNKSDRDTLNRGDDQGAYSHTKTLSLPAIGERGVIALSVLEGRRHQGECMHHGGQVMGTGAEQARLVWHPQM